MRPALTYKEQNLIICQQKDGIVFLTNRNISSKEELKAGPSLDYAIRRNLPVLKPDTRDEKGTNDLIKMLSLEERLERICSFEDLYCIYSQRVGILDLSTTFYIKLSNQGTISIVLYFPVQ